MAIREDSTKTESITVRVPKQLMERARQLVGGGNTAVILTALRLLCGESGESNNVPNTVLQELTERLAVVEQELDNVKKPLLDRKCLT